MGSAATSVVAGVSSITGIGAATSSCIGFSSTGGGVGVFFLNKSNNPMLRI